MGMRISWLGLIVGIALAWITPPEIDPHIERINHAWHAGRSEAWLSELLWMVEHHPGSRLFREEYALWIVRDACDPAIRAQLTAAWLRQAERDPSREVIDNAFRAVVQHDFATAENLLKRARRLYPADPHWTDLLADLYVSAVVPTHRHLRMVRPELVSPEIAERVRHSLEASRDAALLREAGQIASQPENPLLRKVYGASPAGEGWGEHLLVRARQFDPRGRKSLQPAQAAFIRLGSDLP